jgi:oligopeptidase B
MSSTALPKLAAAPAPPAAPPRPSTTVRHGITLTDEFAWLKAPNWQAVMRDPALLDPDIRAYLEAENAYAETTLAGTVQLQETLFAEMKGRIKEDDASVPAPDGPYAYFSRHREGGQHPLICREPRAGGAVETLLDGDALAAGKPFLRIGASAHSSDHKLLAWSADDSGAELYSIRVRDIAAAADLPDLITETTGGTVWSQDGTAFYYVHVDRNHRPLSVHRHRLGTATAEDVEIVAADDSGLFVSLSKVQSGRFAEVSLHDHETSECWLIDLADNDAKPVVVAPRETSVRYSVDHHPDAGGAPGLFILTNAGGAEDFKIAWAPFAASGRANWRDVVPHRAGIFILSFAVLAGWLIRLEREDGLPRIVVRRLADNEEHVIAFDEEAYSLGFETGYEFATDTLRFNYSSMTTPSEVWDYDLARRTRILRKRQEIPSGHDPADYVTRRRFAPAHDGETVPVSLLYRKMTPLDGSAPALVYGYGAYGVSIPAAFVPNRLSLADRGFVVAIAHVRGGTEKGWRWYREGKLAKKANTFRDFIAATEFLIAQRIVSPHRIVAHGGSAGGMLIGAVANARPDLFAALIAEVPFVDVLNTMLDDTLPLTPPEWPEWGNPITDARVTYWEPAKWVARLRRRKTTDSTLVLRVNLDAGHAGAAGRFDRLKEVAIAYAFAVEAATNAAG